MDDVKMEKSLSKDDTRNSRQNANYTVSIDDPLLIQSFIGDIERNKGRLSYTIPSSIIDVLVKFLEVIIQTPLVFSNGSLIFKAGFAGDDKHTCQFPSVYAPRGQNKDFYIANDAIKHKDAIDLKYPIQHGIITDWDGMQTLWRHAFYDQLGYLFISHRLSDLS